MSLFRTILVAADLTERSKRAFRLACSLAHLQKTRVYVLYVIEQTHVAEQPVAFGEGGVVFPTDDTGRTHHAALEERLREFYAPSRAVDVFYEVREGLAADQILGMAEEVACDLIVTGTHGRTGLRRMMTGSVAEAVLRKARCPVLALRLPEAEGTHAETRVIVHPTDFSKDSENALQIARTLARDLGARLVILHVVPTVVDQMGMIPAPMDMRLFRESLAEVRKSVEGADLKEPVETHLKEGDPVMCILDAAREVGADLIVMGTHGRTGVRRFLMGSVAESVIRRADCPVLAVSCNIPAAVPKPSTVPAAV